MYTVTNSNQPDGVDQSQYIFLSYTHNRYDMPIVQRIYNDLRGAGLRVWMDEEITPAISWRREIQDAIENAACFVVVLSPAAKQSTWVEAELDYAETHRKKVFPILIRGHRANAVPIGYTVVQYVDVTNGDYDIGIQKLIAVLRQHLGVV